MIKQLSGDLYTVRDATGEEPETYLIEVTADDIRNWLDLMNLVQTRNLLRIVARSEFFYLGKDGKIIYHRFWQQNQSVSIHHTHIRLRAIHHHHMDYEVESGVITIEELNRFLEELS
jgi:hypothetical protein